MGFKSYSGVIAWALLMYSCSNAQTSLPLYEGTIPNSKKTGNQEKTDKKNGITIVRKISIPTLTLYLPKPATATHTAVIICPGGGYLINAIDHEGYAIAKKFNDIGVAAFVLKYRIPEDRSMLDKSIGPLQDAQQALRMVRLHAKEWNIDPKKVGIMGFSAGGHLASTAGTHFNKAMIENPGNVNLRPDFMILIYPVISMKKEFGHSSSRQMLLGDSPSNEKINLFSNELQITSETPPSFLVHAADDSTVSQQNSLLFYQGLVKYNVPAEIKIYPQGGHGFGLNNKFSRDQWWDRCQTWMRAGGWLPKK